MHDTHLAVLDHTFQQTNRWLKRLEEEHYFLSRKDAYSALRAVLHALRDRLTVEQAAHLGAQLPMLIRGIYYEGWHIGEARQSGQKIEEFVANVERQLPKGFPRNGLSVSHAVFELLSKELPAEIVNKVSLELPVSVRKQWLQPVPAE